MKTRLILTVALLLGLLMGACSDSGDRQTAKDLLATIPGDAAYVAVVNTDALGSISSCRDGVRIAWRGYGRIR